MIWSPGQASASRHRSSRSYSSARRRAPQNRWIRRGGQGHRAQRRPEGQRAARLGVPDQRVADPAARDGLDVQLDQPVLAGAARDRVGPPHPRPPGVLHGDVLAGLEPQALVERDREHGHAPEALLDADHLGRPERRRRGGRLVRGLDHQCRQDRVGVGPGLLGRGSEGRAREPAQRGQQRRPDRLVHGRVHAVLAVIPAQLGQVGGHLVRGAQALHDLDQRLDQPVALGAHGRREQVPQLGLPGEQLAVEVTGDRIPGFGHDRERRADGGHGRLGQLRGGRGGWRNCGCGGAGGGRLRGCFLLNGRPIGLLNGLLIGWRGGRLSGLA